MKKDRDEELDNIFKMRLEDPANHRAYNEDDWDSLEQMLDAGKKRPAVLRWLPIAASIAALLLLFIGWWLFKPATGTDQANNQVAVKPKQEQSAKIIPADTTNTATKQPEIAVTKPTNGQNMTGNSITVKHVKPNASLFSLSAVNTGHLVNNSASTITGNEKPLITVNGFTANHTGYINPLQAPQIIENGISPALAAVDFDTNLDVDLIVANQFKSVVKADKKTNKPGLSRRPQFALSVIASSDLNGVNSFQQSKVGSNYGMLFTAGISKKFTISTGVAYSIKPYMTSFADYHTKYNFKQDPLSVTADCRMLDIPVNVGYQVYHTSRNKISVGTGVSSYIMLHENYKYNYAYDATGPASYTVPNSKSYLLSVVNLNATYEHQLNSKFGISVQPYMKVPLGAVGYSQVKLQSTGVAVGLTWNINSFRP